MFQTLEGGLSGTLFAVPLCEMSLLLHLPIQQLITSVCIPFLFYTSNGIPSYFVAQIVLTFPLAALQRLSCPMTFPFIVLFEKKNNNFLLFSGTARSFRFIS